MQYVSSASLLLQTRMIPILPDESEAELLPRTCTLCLSFRKKPKANKTHYFGTGILKCQCPWKMITMITTSTHRLIRMMLMLVHLHPIPLIPKLSELHFAHLWRRSTMSLLLPLLVRMSPARVNPQEPTIRSRKTKRKTTIFVPSSNNVSIHTSCWPLNTCRENPED